VLFDDFLKVWFGSDELLKHGDRGEIQRIRDLFDLTPRYPVPMNIITDSEDMEVSG